MPLTSVVVLVAFGSLLAGCSGEQETTTPPDMAESTDTADDRSTPSNVVLVVIDTLRADRIHATRNGEPVMPFLSEWAKDNHQFTAATSQSSWTKPSIVSLLSSLYVQTHRVEFGVQREIVPGQSMEVQIVPQDLQMMAELFKDAGYATGAVVANVHLRPDYNFAQGFDRYEYQVAKPAALITDTALDILEGLEEPYFLYVHYLDPHSPYQPPEPFKSAFGPVPEFTAEEKTLLKTGGDENYYMDKVKYDVGVQKERKLGSFSETGREAIRYLYDGECRYNDAEVKRLFNVIEKRDANTVRIVTADHGEEFWEHGSIGHSKTLFQELVNVPLIAGGPGIAPGTTDVPVELIDIMPSLAGLLGLSENDQWQGRAVFATDAAPEPQPVYNQTRMSLEAFGVQLESVRDGEWKLILDHRRPKYLFNLAADPDEKNNLVDQEPERVQALVDLHATHLQIAGAHPAAAKPPPIAGMSEETEEEMRAIGYLE